MNIIKLRSSTNHPAHSLVVTFTVTRPVEIVHSVMVVKCPVKTVVVDPSTVFTVPY